MMKLALIAFAIFFVVTSPAGAANLLNDAIGLLQTIATGAVEFANQAS